MEDDNPLARIRKATRKKLDELHEDEIIQEITNAIGDRRIRDLIDIVAREETTRGWNTVVEFLIKSSRNRYPIPLGYDTPSIKIEPLKYREVLFEVFGCSGWEPVDKSTNELLEETYNASSSIDAARIIQTEIGNLLEDQLERTDTLFFNPFDFKHSLPDSITESMDILQQKQIEKLRIIEQDGSVFIAPLWMTEYGRRTLSNLGVIGDTIEKDEYNMVLSVLQVSPSVREKLEPMSNGKIDSTITSDIPSNKIYNHLLNLIITQDIKGLVELGSRHSLSVLNYTIRNALDQYKSNNDSDSYRFLLSTIRNHIAVRSPESIQILNETSYESDLRIATPSILSLGNFYDESAVSVLVSIICSKKSPEIHKSCFKSIENLRQRYPETQVVIENALSMECKNTAELRRYYRKTWKD